MNVRMSWEQGVVGTLFRLYTHIYCIHTVWDIFMVKYLPLPQCLPSMCSLNSATWLPVCVYCEWENKDSLHTGSLCLSLHHKTAGSHITSSLLYQDWVVTRDMTCNSNKILIFLNSRLKMIFSLYYFVFLILWFGRYWLKGNNDCVLISKNMQHYLANSLLSLIIHFLMKQTPLLHVKPQGG